MRRSGSSHQSSGRYSAHPKRRRPAPPDRVHRHADLAVPDLPQRPRVLPLHPRRTLPLLREPRVVKHPRLHAELRNNPLSTRRTTRAGSHGESAKNCCIDSYRAARLLQPKQRRLQTLPAALLDQPTHIQTRVLPLPHKRQPRHDPTPRTRPDAHAPRPPGTPNAQATASIPILLERCPLTRTPFAAKTEDPSNR